MDVVVEGGPVKTAELVAWLHGGAGSVFTIKDAEVIEAAGD